MVIRLLGQGIFAWAATTLGLHLLGGLFGSHNGLDLSHNGLGSLIGILGCIVIGSSSSGAILGLGLNTATGTAYGECLFTP